MNNKIKLLLMSGAFFCLTASADPIKLPAGMAGTPDIGAVPCAVFSEMIRIGPKGSRLSLLTWAEGYFFAKTGKTLSEILAGAPNNDDAQDFYAITDRFVEYCAANPEAITREAVMAFGGQLMAAGQ